jgi:hypothetical protein
MHQIIHVNETKDQHEQEQYEDIPNDYAIITSFTYKYLYQINSFKNLPNEEENY